ncbi:MAG: glycosyltransferase family 1 protein [Patescibacteria group bacterium]
MAIFAIDASSANKENKTGVEWYAYYIIEQLKQRAIREDEHVVLYSPKPLNDFLALMPEHWKSKILKWPFKKGWMQGRMSFEMFMNTPDVLFVPAQKLPHLTQKCVTVIHDIGPARFPNLYSASVRKRVVSSTKRAVKKAQKIIAVSEFTKQELQNVYHVPENKIVVAPNAVDTTVYKKIEQASVDLILHKYKLGKNFFVLLGRDVPNKNIEFALRAFKIFKSNRGVGDPYELVMIGPDKNNYGALENVRHLGYLPREEIALILNQASAFLFPSLYEGFGVPILEAMACGTPVVASNIAPHKEVCADAAVLLEPSDPALWANTLANIIGGEINSDELIRKGHERVKCYSWSLSAQVVWETMQNLV